MSGVRRRVVAMVGLIALLACNGGTFAADASESVTDDEGLVRREEALREQLKGLLEELDEVRERRRAAGHEESGPPVVKDHATVSKPDAAPEVVLHDVAVISDRVSRRPAGIAESSTTRSEHELQPTRHLRESLESLPGIVTRQGFGGVKSTSRSEARGRRTAARCAT